MRTPVATILFGLALWTCAATSETSAAGQAAGADPASPVAPQACLEAEVNPVTGHAFCVNPRGALVEPPPAASELPCSPDARTPGTWTYGPKCKP
jgi:hypothetical protein